MLNKIIQFSIQQKVLVGLLTLALVAGGLWSVKHVPLDAVPDITNNQVQVITQAPNLGTQDIEQFISYPVELAMANLPGVVEIRSISRSGLSLVTIVFEDDMGTYLPRQLVVEQLEEVRDEIPEQMGSPYMAPISTGLGEIYQYTLELAPEYEDQYSLTDLRSIQDWIIRRQMAMLPGVVEINAIGGSVKQYEIAVNPELAQSMGVSMHDIFTALEQNNANTGGAYIERQKQAYFVRGEGLARNISDLENIVIRTENQVPIRITDIAEVQFGIQTRYGAVTQDGKGEAVGGMVMMMKDGNSNEVIKQVKTRVEEIQKSLPEGVRIAPFLDRSTLIKKTTSTVRNNLLEGALIVIFVLVLLLGNWRGGLIVASTIPLSLLFAFIMMHAFGVSANLMSLGAIDFGIIIDGAVIIVESVVFVMHGKVLKNQKISQKQRDDITLESSSKMMNSAFFGQLIILIVFIPILSLQGIEGKMFRPMALTFMFAMMGVMLLCLTYVPAVSALFLREEKDKLSLWSDRITSRIAGWYDRMLQSALLKGKRVIGVALALLAGSILLFNSLGAEFIPQLDEGDIAFHVMLKPGSSLSETVATTTKVEKLVMDHFPEVEKMVSKIGVAEVPTDPMPMDLADVMVILKPRSEWVSADSKEELIEQIKDLVSVIPGVNYEFSQPIEMRFNELLQGVREDIAIKIYGDNIDTLAMKAEEISELVAGTAGIGDLKAEATTGLPQITVRFERDKVAQYGLNIEELNALVQTAFAGKVAGVIFEGEKRFDLVVRQQKDKRGDIQDLKNLYVNLPDGSQLPLSEVAKIDFEAAPMQISRDNTRRRTYVGINVRGRDIQSLIGDIQQKLDARLELPPGYYLKYGGAFENLQRAVGRLKWLVPVSLLLIFLLIFMALKSMSQTLMIFTSIPMASIGGVLALALRDMPFSISAGIGFIVLFGVAVLNGLVLVSSWNELKAQTSLPLEERVRKGATRRIRPILLTALTDILGFMPMALSTTAGAEVQRPLATVVIGGMVSATLLTLIVLPVFYSWLEKRQGASPKTGVQLASLALLIGLGSHTAQAQEKPTSISTAKQAVALALQQNKALGAADLDIASEQQGLKKAFNPDKTALGMQYGQMNGFANDWNFEASQSFAFPTVYSTQRKLAKERVNASRLNKMILENVLRRKIRIAWNQLQMQQAYNSIHSEQDSLYRQLREAVQLRHDLQKATYLELVNTGAKAEEAANQLHNGRRDLKIAEMELQVLINDSIEHVFTPRELAAQVIRIPEQEGLMQSNPLLQRALQEQELAGAEKRIAVAKMLPDFNIGYFNMSMIGFTKPGGGQTTSQDRFDGVNAGITIPLFFGSQKAAVKTAKIQTEKARLEAEYLGELLNTQYGQQRDEVAKNAEKLRYYETSALQSALLIQDTATESYMQGAISYLEYFESMKQVWRLRKDYIQTLGAYNESVIALHYLLGI